VIYLDSCLVIYLVETGAPAHAAVRQAVADAVGATFAVSPLVIMECLVGPLRSGDETLRESYDRTFDALPLVPLDPPVFRRAARLRASHGLKTPDALHLATALECGCEALWTNDDRLRRAAGDFVRVVGRTPGA
jgi:predicted nucleic acid-binding protein